MILPVPPSELTMFWRVNTDEDKKPINPHEVIYDFFTTYDLKGIRVSLWELLKLALENRSITGEEGQIGNFIFLYEKLNDLVTANYILNRDNNPTEIEKQSEVN